MKTIPIHVSFPPKAADPTRAPDPTRHDMRAGTLQLSALPPLSLYVHVPFCPTICPFCSFHVLERRSAAVDAYLERLDAELAAAEQRGVVDDHLVSREATNRTVDDAAEHDRIVDLRHDPFARARRGRRPAVQGRVDGGADVQDHQRTPSAAVQ